MLLTATLLGSSLAFATPENWETFKSVYEIKASSRIFKTECMTCHTEVPKHNPFGMDAKTAAASNKGVLTLEILRSLESKDSDGDGWPNLDEIKQDTLPGDPSSHPAGMPPKATSHENMMGKDMDRSSGGEKSLLDVYVPKHSFHPLVVHFPIALFIFGAGLEFFGWRKRHEVMRQAGWWCILFGTLSTVLAVTTGLAVFLRSGFEWQGTPLTHFVLAVSATLLMTTTVLWRRKAAHETYTYFVLLLLATVLVGAAGHFGAQLVYGG